MGHHGRFLHSLGGDADSKSRDAAELDNVGINIDVAAPMSFFPFSCASESCFGDLYAQGRDAARYFIQKKVVADRWPEKWSRRF